MIVRELDAMSFGCYDVVSMSCVLLWLVMICLRFMGLSHLVYDNYGVFLMNCEYWLCCGILGNYGYELF